MKKWLIAVGVLLMVCIALIAIPLNSRYASIRYNKQVQMTALYASSSEEGWLKAEHDGVTTNVLGRNIGRISNMITPTECKHVLFAPDLEAEITLTFSNGDVITISEYPQRVDCVLVHMTGEGGSYNFSIEGYGVIENVGEAISLEGASNANELWEGE